VAALNEPMAVARHGVNRPPARRTGGAPSQPKPPDKVVVFGASPIGLGRDDRFKSVGVSHVDLIPARLVKALAVGADAVINSADEQRDHHRRIDGLPGESAKSPKTWSPTGKNTR